jgi:hypothetical protein
MDTTKGAKIALTVLTTRSAAFARLASYAVVTFRTRRSHREAVRFGVSLSDTRDKADKIAVVYRRFKP